MGKLTVNQVKALEKPGLHADGGTLYLRVAPGGSKQWMQRLTIDGKRRDLGLGGFPLVSLAEARDMAIDNRRKARRGGDPLADKRKVAMPTFRQAARETWEGGKKAGRWRSKKVIATWWQQMERHALKRLGDMPVDRVGREDVLAVLTPLWTSKPEMGRKMRMRIRETLEWAQAHGYVDSNIAGEAIEGALPKTRGKRTHFRSMPYAEVSEALATVAKSGASPAAKHCLALTILTAVRSGEARAATWAEVDLEAATWTIPGERTKTGKEHRVPLSDAAVAVLEQARDLREKGSDLVFPSPRGGKPLSDMTLTKVLRTCGLADRATVHGFRASFRTWASEKTNAEHAVMEMALAHKVGNAVEQAYARSDLFDKRRVLMDQWAGYLTGYGAKVVKLRRS